MRYVIFEKVERCGRTSWGNRGAQPRFVVTKWRLVSTGVCFSLLGLRGRLGLNWSESKEETGRRG